MGSSASIIGLKDFFPETSWSQTIPALRQDAIVWGAIQDQEFSRLAMSELGTTPQAWTPANLALLSLGYKLRAVDLRNVPNSLPADLLDKAKVAFKTLTADSERSLNQAGLIALALRDKPDLWSTLPGITLVNTALTCLYSLVPDQPELLAALSLEQILHILLSNPLSILSQVNILEPLLSAAPADQRFSILNSLGAQRPQIAKELIDRLSKKIPSATPGSNPTGTAHARSVTSRLTSPLSDLQTHLQQADLQHLSAKPEDARLALASAQAAMDQIQIRLTLQAAQAAAQAGDAEEALSIWKNHARDQTSDDSIALALTLIEHGFVCEAKSISESYDDQAPPSTAALLLKAKLALQEGDINSAQALAKQALNTYHTEDVHTCDEHAIATQLLELNLTDKAILLARQCLDARPNDLSAAQIMAKALRQAGIPDEALIWSHLSVTLDPESLDLRRDLAETLESLGEWPQALDERQQIIQQAREFDIQDHLSLANCALHAKRPQLTAEICEQILELDSEDGFAHTLLGKAFYTCGEIDEGIEHFEKAIQLTPGRADPWLALAEAFHEQGEHRKAHQSLLTASRAAPDSPEIHFALGNTYREYEAPTKARKSYQRAMELVSTQQSNLGIEITQALGNTLIELGHIDQANQILGAAHRSKPSHPGLAHAYGRILLTQDQPEDALAPLSMGLKNDPTNQGIQFDYARAQVAAHTQLDQAEKTLKALVKLDPEHSLAIGLLAETLEINAKYQAALEAYHQALGTELTQDSAWMKRLSLGLSRVALKFDQAETALAALENAWGKNPEDNEIARMLAEVYRANNLPNKALQVARSAMQANLTNLDIVIWFAELATKLDAPREALEAIDRGLQLDPQRPQLHLKKGDIHLRLEDFAAACQSFDQIMTLEYATAVDLATAAEGLIVIGDIPRAAASLERAVALSKSYYDEGPGEKAFLINLLKHLASTHEANHDYQAALEVIEEALLLAKEDSFFEESKAALLIKLGQFEKAIAWIESSLERSPDNPRLHLYAARIQRTRGNLNTAVYHAQKAVDGFGPGHNLTAIILKAELALGMMQPDLADQVLHGQSVVVATTNADLIAFYCLKGEIALSKGAEIAAADALTAALKIGEQHPRTLALQARLHLRQANSDEAYNVLENALITLGDCDKAPSTSPEIYLAIAQAASECQAWDSALYLLKEASKIAPREPRPVAELAQTLVRRAEHQQLCQLLNLQNNGIGKAASSDHAYEQFEAAILSTTQNLDALRDAIIDTNYYQDFLATWLSRGQAIFKPSLEHAQALTDLQPTPDNQAAYLAAQKASGKSIQAGKTALAIHEAMEVECTHPELWGYIALALAETDHELASDAAQTALDNAIRSAHPNYPIFHALKALVAQQTGDRAAQLKATQDLLKVWENEPHWHILAAELLIEDRESPADSAIQSAITHLEKATQLEPLQVAHYQKLGSAYLIAQNSQAAIRALKRATNLAPKDLQPWQSLAEIYLLTEQLRQAEKCALQALQLDPQMPNPNLVLAEVALKNGFPQKTAEYASKVLDLKPGEPQALLLQADALIAMNKQARALEVIEAASARILPTTELLLKTVELRRHVQGEKAGLESLNSMVANHPGDPQILVAHALALAEAGDQHDAIQAAQRALQRSDVEFATEDQANLLHTLGHLLRRNGQLDQAVKHLSQAIDHTPDWVDPYIELGRTYHQRRQYDQALQTFQQAIAIAPSDPRPYYRAGMTLKETKDYPNAETMLRNAARLTPEDVSVQRQLAAIVALNLVHNPKNVLSSIRSGS